MENKEEYTLLGHTLELMGCTAGICILRCTCCTVPMSITLHELDLHKLSIGKKYCYSFDNTHFVGEYSTVDEILNHFASNPEEAEQTIIYIGIKRFVSLVDVFDGAGLISMLQEDWEDTFGELFEWPLTSTDENMLLRKVATVLEGVEIGHAFVAEDVIEYNLLEYK